MTSKQEPYRLALLQLETDSSYQKNLNTLIEYIKNNQDRELILAPEVYLTAYDYDNFEEAINFYEIAIEALLPLISTQILVFTIIKRDGKDHALVDC
ncbi:MAG TPA: hypothetical protein EYP02_08445 [Sulfurovum sp.]|nr:hypothetical protein [Sulfurovum sp.]